MVQNESIGSGDVIPPFVEGERREVGVGELSMTEVWWLDHLRQSPADDPITPELLVWANTLLVDGSRHIKSTDTPHLRQATIEARQTFSGVFLRFDQPDHPVHKNYALRKAQKSTLSPCDTFVESQRFLYKKGINGLKVAGSSARTSLTRSVGSLQELLSALEDVDIDPLVLNEYPGLVGRSGISIKSLDKGFRDEDLSLAKLAKAKPRLLSIRISSEQESIKSRLNVYTNNGIKNIRSFVRSHPQALVPLPSTVDRRFERIYEISSRLSWLGSVPELVEHYPEKTVLVKDNRREVYAHLLLKHGDRSWQASKVGSLLFYPPESHILALALGHPYSVESVRAVNNGLDNDTRHMMVESILTDESPGGKATRKRIGGSALRAYQRYIEGKTPSHEEEEIDLSEEG